MAAPEKRDAIVASLKAGLDYINNRMPTLAQVRSLVLAPLKEVALKFAKTLIGEAADAAPRAVKAWLDSLL